MSFLKRFLMLLSGILLLIPDVNAQQAQIRIPITVTNSLGHAVAAEFGVDPNATYCIDPLLGEFELPAGGCSGPGICLAFKDTRTGDGTCLGEGLLLDLRAYNSPAQVDTYRVTFTFQNYPIVFRWSSGVNLYYDSLKIVDGVDGSVINVDMFTYDSLRLEAPVVGYFLILASGPKGTTAINDEDTRPKSFSLLQNYPNPFNPSTTIKYELPAIAHVTLSIFDLLGREITTFSRYREAAGEHSYVWDASALPSGVYFYRLQAGSFQSTKKLILMK